MGRVLGVCFAVVLTGLAGMAGAADVYKWVDENGRVHFGQMPPAAANQPVEQVENVTSAVRPRLRGKEWYCGEERLPVMRESRRNERSAAYEISSLSSNIDGWHLSIERVEKDRLAFLKRMRESRRSGVEELRRYDERIAVLRCKIDWAEGRMNELKDDKEAIGKRHATLKAAIDDLEQRRLRDCGKDERTGVVMVDDAYRARQRCNEPYERELRKLRSEFRSVEQEYEMVR
ncbi:MAG: DUF4124 domain-containing protein [Halothiobacillaceae bacterium]|nr:DUF4124 domain-containing protein [Halothiobacillaceae bacterium]